MFSTRPYSEASQSWSLVSGAFSRSAHLNKVCRVLQPLSSLSGPVHLCLCYFCLNSSSWCLWPALSCMRKLIYLCPRQTTYPMTVTISASYNEGACHVIPQSPHPFWGLVQIERRGGLPSLHQLFSSVGWVPGSVISRPNPSLFSFYCLAFSLLLFLFLN